MGIKDFIKKGWKDNERARQEAGQNAAYGVFEALSIFDWITPLVGIGQTVIHDPTPLQTNSWTFFIPYRQALKSGWNENDIRGLLHQYGINSWASQITNGELFFTIDIDQSQWAEYLLQKHGIPINQRFAGAPPPRSKR